MKALRFHAGALLKKMDNEIIIKKLRQLEAQAEQLRNECCKTRKLIEGGVSTPATDQDEDARRAVVKRNLFLMKKSLAVTRDHQ